MASEVLIGSDNVLCLLLMSMEEKHHGYTGPDHDADKYGIMGRTQEDDAYTESGFGADPVAVIDPTPITRNKSDKLIGAQDTGGAQVYASRHQTNEILNFTFEVSQQIPWSKNRYIVWKPSDEKNQGIGHSYVAENHLCGLQPNASQDWTEIMDKQKDVGHSPNPNLEKQDDLKSHFLNGFQGYLMSRHGEDFSG
ncbi:hypothetical protein STEG23_027719 [Scotinomys teguina]